MSYIFTQDIEVENEFVKFTQLMSQTHLAKNSNFLCIT